MFSFLVDDKNAIEILSQYEEAAMAAIATNKHNETYLIVFDFKSLCEIVTDQEAHLPSWLVEYMISTLRGDVERYARTSTDGLWSFVRDQVTINLCRNPSAIASVWDNR